MKTEDNNGPTADSLLQDVALHERWIKDPKRGKRLEVPAGSVMPWIDLSGRKLDGANLADVDMSAATLVRTSMVGTSLANTILTGVDLSTADLTKADLRGTILVGANLRDARLVHAEVDRAEFRRADLRGAILDGATVVDTNFRGAALNWASACSATFRGVRFDGCDLRGVGFHDALISGCTLQGADLSDANFELAHVGNSGMARTQWKGAIAKDAFFDGVDLREADMREVYLSGFRGRALDLRHADIRGADFGLAVIPGLNVDAALTSEETAIRGFRIERDGAHVTIAHDGSLREREADNSAKSTEVPDLQYFRDFVVPFVPIFEKDTGRRVTVDEIIAALTTATQTVQGSSQPAVPPRVRDAMIREQAVEALLGKNADPRVTSSLAESLRRTAAEACGTPYAAATSPHGRSPGHGVAIVAERSH